MTNTVRLMSIDADVDGVKETTIFAVEDDSVVGCISVRHKGRRAAEVRQLFVVAERRMSGIGRVLLENACLLARNSKCETIGLYLLADNECAWGFYRSCGFIRAYEYENGSWVVCRKLGD